MFNHAPENYVCPICLAVKGIENEQTWIVQNDIVYQDELVMALISSKFIVGNEGHVLVVSKAHYENIYDLPDEVAGRIAAAAKKVALALKQARKCDGVTLVQNNEPAGDQHAFHYHLHVVPRFEGDNFHVEGYRAERSSTEERVTYATELRKLIIV